MGIDVNQLAREILEINVLRNWPQDWMARGVYLHLEASEFIESIRGKGKTPPLKEAADVLITLMTMTQIQGIEFESVLIQAQEIVDELRTKPKYPGEQSGGRDLASQRSLENTAA